MTVAGWLLGWATPASASCVTPPVASPALFMGTVLSTERDGLIARVRTDDGRDVTVSGTPSAHGATSVDRTYRLGTRYEFHPVNTTNPYQDNICTATHAVAPVPSVSSSPGASAGTSAPAYGEIAWVGGGALALGAAGAWWLVVRSRRRGRQSRP